MRKVSLRLPDILSAAFVVLVVIAFSYTGVTARPTAQSTVQATLAVVSPTLAAVPPTLAANASTGGACPTGLAAQIAQTLSASPATPEAMATSSATMAATKSGPATSPVCLVAELSGSNEVPVGDPKGSGFVAISVDPTTNSITFEVAVSNITLPAVANHIHIGVAGANGAVVVPAAQAPDASGKAMSTTQNVDPSLVQNIIANPAGYYFNVHTTDFPNGAMRGQLEVYDPADFPMMATASPGMSATPSS